MPILNQTSKSAVSSNLQQDSANFNYPIIILRTLNHFHDDLSFTLLTKARRKRRAGNNHIGDSGGPLILRYGARTHTDTNAHFQTHTETYTDTHFHSHRE